MGHIIVEQCRALDDLKALILKPAPLDRRILAELYNRLNTNQFNMIKVLADVEPDIY